MNRRIRHWLLLSILLVCSGQAQIVTTNSDSGPGSLRQAVADAQVGDTITFAPALSGQTIALTNGLIGITKSVTIDASALVDGVIIHGQGQNSLFHSGSQTTNTLIGLTLTGGRSAFGGGAILNDGLLKLDRCTLIGNSANEGGALFQFTSTTLNNCTIVSNRARFGGAIENDGGTLTLNNCTLAGNVATNEAGAILSFFTLNLNHCTVVGNQASAGGGILMDAGGPLNLHNSIVAGNTAPFEPQISGGISSATGSNIISGNPLLAPLGNYGGPTPTMPPLPGSPAVDAGGSTSLTNDQRGFARLVGSAADIGAVEGVFNPDLPLLNPTRLGDGSFQFAFANLAGMPFSVRASTNMALPLNVWSNLGPVLETPPGSGQFQFTDPQAANFLQRFYRVKSP
jgi:hypothetical protein